VSLRTKYFLLGVSAAIGGLLAFGVVALAGGGRSSLDKSSAVVQPQAAESISALQALGVLAQPAEPSDAPPASVVSQLTQLSAESSSVSPDVQNRPFAPPCP
jgi:hypothetical protein